MSLYHDLCSKVRAMIKQAFVSQPSDDSGDYPITQVTTDGNTSNALRISVYGVCSNPPANSHALLFNLQGQESNKAAILNDFVNRRKNLKEYETCLINNKTKAEILIADDGTIIISNASDTIVNGNLKVTGTITADQDVLSDNANTPVSLTNHLHIGNLGYNTDKPIPQGQAGTPKPSNAPTAIDGDLDMKTNDVKNVGSVSSIKSHTHKFVNADGATSTTQGPE